MRKRKLILGCALMNCVHIAGLNHFLKLAEGEGFETISLGAAVPVERLLREIKKHKPDIAALSYRLTPEVAKKIFSDLKNIISKKHFDSTKFILGCTPAVAKAARGEKIFARIFDGTESLEEIKAFLRNQSVDSSKEVYPQTLVERIRKKYPYPVIRHHFGRPALNETIKGVRKISKAGVLDVISLGTDQNAQEFFFNPELMKKYLDGAGGVPVRKREDLAAIYKASRCGNFPLMRCYSGTNNLIQWAEMSLETIHNAWAAIPLTWYSVMDGRSKRSLKDAITENQAAMRWYAAHNIPVEVNESHQWSLRDAHDSLAVAAAYLAAYNAKKMNVKKYISQYMFNTPPGTSPEMDIAKMQAKNILIGELSDENFEVFREVRAGIAHFSADPLIAKGQLAASAITSLFLKPHILHVVAYCEGNHAVYPDELIESCKIVHGVIQNSLNGLPDISDDKKIRERRDYLMKEAKYILTAIKNSGRRYSDDPLSDPGVIARAIKKGILDTPHFEGNPFLYGKIKTNLSSGGWNAVNTRNGEIIRERERLKKYLKI